MLFNETILIYGDRANGQKIYASDIPARMVDDGTDDGAIDGLRANPADQFTFFFPRAEWPSATPPQIGDTIVRNSDGAKFAATRVTHLADCFSVNARSR